MTQETQSLPARVLHSPLMLLALFGLLTAVVAAFAMGSSVQVGSATANRSGAGVLNGYAPESDTAGRANGLACPIVDDGDDDTALTPVEPPAPREGELRGLAVIPTSSVQLSGNDSQSFPEITSLVGGTARPPANPSPFIAQSDSNLFGLSIEDHALWLLGGASLVTFTAGFILLRRARDQ